MNTDALFTEGPRGCDRWKLSVSNLLEFVWYWVPVAVIPTLEALPCLLLRVQTVREHWITLLEAVLGGSL